MNAAPKHLFLMRHASAGPAADDRTRPLTPAGRIEAVQMGRALSALAIPPARALASPARRAQETLDAVRSHVELEGIETDEALYLASAAALRMRLEGVPEATSRLLVIGHNPGLSELLHERVESGAKGLRPRASHGLAPGAVAVLRFDGPWRELAAAPAHLVELLTPG